ncbi:MAG: hypothetical protein QOF29_2325 [bacterium]|jgi:hypothetical protein
MLKLNRAATMRTSEAERQRVADLLRDACAEGRLGADELDDRLDRLFTSHTVADLEGLVWDLPGGEAVLPGLWPVARTASAPAPRGNVAVRAGVTLLALAVLAVAFSSLPGFVTWAIVGIVVALVVTTGMLAVVLAPVGLAVYAVAWLVARLFRGRPEPHPRGRGYPLT